MDERRLNAAVRLGNKSELASEETEGARLLGGRYVLTPDGVIKRIKGQQKEKDIGVVWDAVRALLLSDARWRTLLNVPLAVGLPHLDTRDRVVLINRIGGLRRVAAYAQYLTAFHPRHVLYLAARLAIKSYPPQPVWNGNRPPNAETPLSSADLVAWQDLGRGTRPLPRVRRFPPTIYAAYEFPETAKTVAALSLPPQEYAASISEAPHRDSTFVQAIAFLLFKDEALEPGPNPSRYGVALFLALTGRVFEEPGSELPPEGVDNAFCLRVAETLGRLHARKAPELLF